MKNIILIYTEQLSPRIEYVFDFIFSEFSGLEFELTIDLEEFKNSNRPKINFSRNLILDVIQLIPDKFLFENTISETIKFEELNEIGKIFFALSRYEEYWPQEKDQHGRISGKGKVYKTPFVDSWILGFQEKLKSKYPQLEFKNREFGITMTCDVDQVWQYKHKGFKRTYGAFLRDFVKLNFKEFAKRKKIISGKEKDPFDTFEVIKKWMDSFILRNDKNVKMIFFWLMADYGAFDKNNPVSNLAFQEKIKEIAAWSESGVHPSYASNSNPEKLEVEIKRLEKILGKKIRKSRQHYIKLSFPETYQNLIQKGIQEDYSMGYADETGFRAGTCTPFYWYDVSKEEKTDLKIFPFCAMDVTMRNYMKLSIDEAIQEIQRLKSEIQKVNGNFCVLFHNSNLKEDWEGWEKVIESLFE
ncbi:polysaccharide deacetylase family protein [Moheibacter lacus]|uniref:Polysaccharide deacetylase family protein n=1 Tax=Moheibacter lacus TaxID=2745851 RepID=A0A838ZK32_9FLAO|nr:polysaccharide deacetylase family protein [Moheibacter lacus]MBA5628734.1 polysaccharide deacetylase family protein [Moheibacter lacus]